MRCSVVGKRLEDVKIVVSGAGAAAISISKLLLRAGARDVTLCDRKGAIYAGRTENMNWIKTEMAEVTNLRRQAGTLADVVRDADVFIGVSQPGLLTGDMVRTMHRDAIVFACANPTPEIFPEEAKAGGCGRRQHRPQRLSEPDQQRAGFPGHLPRRVRRARIATSTSP